MQTASVCPTCHGEGKIIAKPCGECSGSGLVKEMEEISFKIPAGVAQGMQLTVQGKGNAAKRGGINGDLLVVIEEEEHADLQRDPRRLPAVAMARHGAVADRGNETGLPDLPAQISDTPARQG